MIIRFTFSLIFAVLAGTGCNLIYKQNIQQGNAIEQDDLDELYIGMNQRQVLFVLGTPSVKDPFQRQRWDYVQTFSRRGSPMVQRTVTLTFEDDLLANISGQNDPFGASTTRVSGDASEVASFIKGPDDSSDDDAADDSANDTGASSKDDTGASPQDASMESAEEEVLEAADPNIESIRERTSEDAEYLRDQELLDQTPNDDMSGPDIDG